MALKPQIIHNIFDKERFSAVKSLCKQLIDNFNNESDNRLFIDGRHVKIISDFALEVLPLAEIVFNCKLKYMHSALVEYEGEFASLGIHKDQAENLKLLDIAISQDFLWPITVDNVEYTFGENCALAFESGKLMHERVSTIDMKNKKVSMLLLYYSEIKGV
jgi:hypothetical protein